MITVTKLTYTPTSVKVELDDGEKLQIHIEVAQMHSLRSGNTLSDLEYRQLKEESERFTCREKAMKYLAIRARSGFEMNHYLKKKGFSEYIIKETITRLKELNYIDDFDFAVTFIRHKIDRKTVGKNILIRDLMHKGIEKKLIDRAIKETSADLVNIDEVLDLAQSKFESVKHKKNSKEKVAYFLKSRGFDGQVIGKIIRQLEDHDE